jgi:cyclophilin family peptidyl-prolyl cis-trans isomerase
MMNPIRTRAGLRLCRAAGVIWACGTLSALAQETPAPDFAALRAEVRPVRPIYSPDGPIFMRFTLVNTSDRPIDIPLETAAPVEDGLVLPSEVVLGSAASRPLSITFESEAARDVPPPAAPARPVAATTVRLAPRGALGTELDLRALCQYVRYPGQYHVNWRPLNGRVAAPVAEFRVEGRKDVIMVTDYGKVTFVLDYEHAPINVDNFLDLVRSHFYDGKLIHRIRPGEFLQGGSPNGAGSGIRPDGRFVVAEFSDQPVEAGTLMMARKKSDANSASCQFLVALARQPDLDRQYTIIGQATDPESLRTLNALAAVQTDPRDRPRHPLAIRSMNPVERDSVRARQLEQRTPATAPSYTPPDATAAAKKP